ncbi:MULTISPECIES: sensor histidine kinase [unclassified Spirosoma]|uniref:sensor histidine kinase n=1 Tax=unclassified Spirosoma TaxID=2621999 RepID=UPI000959114A|nr:MULTISPECIES: sensor histidine kinase [unclassified Spirosoma]MBN8823493.1 histidine kinase [Spirosoma sp.]OJW71897.1 MAG: sensor protein lytS [Spirosoma sp. 48-14]
MKRWAKFDRYDFLIYLLNYPAVFIANYVVFGPAYFQDRSLFLGATLIVNSWGIVIFVTLTLWMKYMRFVYGAPDQFGQRLLYSMLMYVGVMMSVILSIYWIYDQLGYPYKPETIPWVLMIGFVTNVTSAGCHESIFTYNQLRESTQREYRLKQLHMQQQMDVLKQQVNPHFLFNSLNSLLTLIGENPSQAEIFTEELSSVYRYVLRANEQDLTDLATELDFINSYTHLLKTRYGAGFQLTVQVDSRFQSFQLPPLTLQLLVENAVKHNIVMKSRPLTVDIQTDGLANLHVRNNIQKKKQGVVSNGVGLTNILAKYEMLGQPRPSVREETGQFVVALPLIPA